MTDVIIAPRLEDPLSDTEAVINGGYFQVRSSRWNSTSGQWISDAWPAPIPLTGVAVTTKLDASAVPYELYVNYPDGRGGFAERTEFRTVVASGSPVKWEDLVLVSGPGADPAPSGDLAARVAALEAAILTVSGGASTLAAITDMSAPARTFNSQASYTTMRTTLGAASTSNETFTGTTSLATVNASGNATITGNLSVGGTVSIVDGALAIADVTGLQAALDAKSGISAGTVRSVVAVSGSYAARPATTDPVFFIGSVQPAATGSTAGGGGMVPSLDQWFETP